MSVTSRVNRRTRNAQIRLKLNSKRETDVRFSVDGLKPIPLTDGAELTITRSAHSARLVCLNPIISFAI